MPRVAFSLATISLIFPEAPANDPFGGRFWHLWAVCKVNLNSPDELSADPMPDEPETKPGS